jgi:hypothetical protein
MNPESIYQLLVLAALIEALVQTVKPVWQPEQRTVTFFVTLGVGFLFSISLNYLAGLDIFTILGVPLVKLPVVGVIATGILLSRGAQFVHDLIQIVTNFKAAVSAWKPAARLSTEVIYERKPGK